MFQCPVTISNLLVWSLFSEQGHVAPSGVRSFYEWCNFCPRFYTFTLKCARTHILWGVNHAIIMSKGCSIWDPEGDGIKTKKFNFRRGVHDKICIWFFFPKVAENPVLLMRASPPPPRSIIVFSSVWHWLLLFLFRFKFKANFFCTIIFKCFMHYTLRKKCWIDV